MKCTASIPESLEALIVSLTATAKCLRVFPFRCDRHDLFTLVAKSIPTKPRSAVKNASLSCPKPKLYVHPTCKASNMESPYLDIQLYLDKSYAQDTSQHAQLSLGSGFVLLILTSITTVDFQHAGPFGESFRSERHDVL